jgi:hypothetical protein
VRTHEELAQAAGQVDGTLVESLHRRFLKDGDKLWKD